MNSPHSRPGHTASLVTAAALSLWGLVLRTGALAGRSLSGDEEFQLHNTAGAFQSFWLHHQYGDHTSFPGEYLLTYPFVRLFGADKWGLAVPHILATLIGFWLLYVLGRRFFRTTAGFAVAFAVFSLNANLITHSFEFRPYAVLPVLALGSLVLWDTLIRRSPGMKKTGRTAVWLFFLFTAAYHAYGILILLLPAFFVCFTRAGEEGCSGMWKPGLRTAMAAVIIPAVLVWGWYASSSAFGLTYVGGFYSVKDTFLYIPDPLARPVGFSKCILGNLIGFKPLYVLLLGPAAALFTPGPERTRQIVYLLGLVALPIGLILLVDVRSQYWFLQRQFIWVIPYFALYLGWTWDTVVCFLRDRRH